MWRLMDQWEGTGSQAAFDEASSIISEHEANATAVQAVGERLNAIEASIVKTKTLLITQRMVNSQGEAKGWRFAEKRSTGLRGYTE